MAQRTLEFAWSNRGHDRLQMDGHGRRAVSAIATPATILTKV